MNNVKLSLLALALLVGSTAGAQTVYSNIEQNSNWKLCTGPCAGGTQPISANVYLNQRKPSLDGKSTQLYEQGNAWADALFIRELGANNAVSRFQTDFYFYLSNSATKIGQAFEFDTFQFINNVAGAPGPVEFMWGTQCDYGQNGGVWDIWSQDLGQWIPMYGMPCVNLSQSKFLTGVWYHVIWNLHRVAPGLNMTYGGMSYDSVRIIEYGGSRNTITSDHTYTVNSVQRAGPLPSGWSDQLGVQFQIDLNGQANTSGYPNAISEWLDKVTLRTW